MPRQKLYRSSEKGRRGHSPQSDHSHSRGDVEISQAETSAEFHGKDDHSNHSREDRKRSSSRSSHRKSYHNSRQKDNYRKRSPKRNHRRSRSFESPNNQSREFSKSRVIFDREKIEKFSSSNREKDEFRQRQAKDSFIPEKIDQRARIIDEIQRFDYQRLNYEQIREKFIQSCSQHLNFVGLFPEASTTIGTQLLKDGLFHEMWSLAFLKSNQASKETMLQSYYVLFRPIVSRNLTNFERTFNAIPEEEKIIRHKYTSNIIDHRICDDSTRSTTKMNVMLLYEQVKGDMRVAEIEQNLVKKVERSIEEFKLKIDEYLQENPDSGNEWFDDDKAIANWTANEENKEREATIEKIKKSKMQERSPLSNRFRLMHEVQSNERRMMVEMACLFLKLEKFYYFNDLHIVKVDEIIISQNQEIIVVKAYSVDFCPLMVKMKIQPKLKNMIAVYKFSNLQELIRLENTHGKFDGIIVYPESFNVQKYLTSSDEISLLKSQCIEQIKEQINDQILEQARQY